MCDRLADYREEKERRHQVLTFNNADLIFFYYYYSGRCKCERCLAMQVHHSSGAGRHLAACRGYDCKPPSWKQTLLNRHKDGKLGEEEKQKIEPLCVTHEI